MIAEARFYDDIGDLLARGAVEALEEAGATFERIKVPGALEIPPAIAFGANRKEGPPFDAFVALGCVLRGETSHYDIVAGESARALIDLASTYGLPLGNGILTCETRAQALVRADPAGENKGAHAVRAALRLLDIKTVMGL
ncbi:MAG: 6,7-dimethyl-8-ribityllumazine synthase [Alphaproteobacteria bacterium]|nr:6,7-dimethyl-8-ribityllumazine synthase [Alphaproteobacteria bacterium]